MFEDWRKPYIWVFLYALMFVLIGFAAARPLEIWEGLKTIVSSSSILITDYFALAGIGATFVNVGLVTFVTGALMYLCDMPIKSGNIITLGLMSGFSFFGKNIFNMWFIFFGTVIFCWFKKEKLSKYILQSCWATSLGPLVSATFFYDGLITISNIIVSLLTGLIIGFVIPVLTNQTQRIIHGLNLYNGGLAAGLMAMMMTPILKAFGYEFSTVNIWATQYTEMLLIIFIVAGAVLVLAGIFDDKYALKNYLNLLKRTGNPADDFLELDGRGAVLINMGMNVIFSTIVLVAIGGDINGATIGGILTIAGFSVKGKTTANMIPIMLGIILSGVVRGNGAVASPAAQLALLFGTTLAPVAGTYGFAAGIIAGFTHSCVVLYAGAGYSGVNLYNNGFCGGLVCIVMHAVLSDFFRPRVYNLPSDSMMPKDISSEKVDLRDLDFY